MDLQQAYYESKFQNHFLRQKGNAFQDFFAKLMALAYKTDFMPSRPWGNRGDRKNDGYLKSERRLFQVYAPNEIKESDAVAKIREDFEGAKEHWGGDFDKWTFVHNAADGLPPHVLRVILDFEKDNPGISIEPWGEEKLLTIFRALAVEDMESWFGPALTPETRANLRFRDLQEVLETIAKHPTPFNQPVKDIPMGKIEANALSESVTILLKNGMAKTPLVQEYFDKRNDPAFGEQIAEAFRAKYESLRDWSSPDEIFSGLQAWAGGSEVGTPVHQLAVLTVMAYFFERCDIFEEPRGDRS